MLKPKLFTTLHQYSWKQFQADAISGVIVGVVALPLAIAFAIASGVSPDKGLVTAVIAGFLISVLGGSRVQIGGPTGAFVVIVYGIVQKHGIDGLTVATLMGGLFLLVMGLARFGGVIKFIPYPVTVGFTSGIALIIFSSQVKDFLGLDLKTVPSEFFEKWGAYAETLHTANPHAAILALVTVIVILWWQKVTKKIPGSIVALLLTTLIAYFFKFPVETIGSRFGEIPHTLPMPHFPEFDFKMIRELIQPAFAIAILAGIESLLSAVVADGMIGAKHRSNMELVAQGVANIVSPLFGGIPATGAIARTATNVHNGGRTPVAGIVHALTLFLIMLFFAKWAALIPLATLAGILVVVAYRMSEWHSFQMTLKAPASDVAVLLVTFTLTVVIDLTVAIEIGMVLAAFLLMYRMSQSTDINVITHEFFDEEDREDPGAVSKRKVPEGVEIFEINGPFFFGVASTFIETMSNIENKPKVRIIRMRHVRNIDATAINALRQVFLNSQKNGIAFILSGVHAELLPLLKKAALFDLIGKENILDNIDKALHRAKEIV